MQIRGNITYNDERSFQIRRHGLKIMQVCPDLAELDNYVKINKWYALGLLLGIKDKKLDAIKTKYDGDIDQCRRAMFRLWIYTTSTPTRKVLLDALRTKQLNEITIANAYEKLLKKARHEGMRNSLDTLLRIHDADHFRN